LLVQDTNEHYKGIMQIDLTWPEIRTATEVAVHRQMYDFAKGMKHHHGLNAAFFDSFGINIRGCVAEIATAKALGVYWTGLGGFGLPDVGAGIEVRAISNPGHRLIMHDDDPDEYIGVLAYVGDDPKKVRILGWLPASDCKKKEFLKDPVGGREAYFIPQTALRDISSLSEYLGRKNVKYYA